MTINTTATKRILIIDDQPRVLDTLREIVASLLRRQGLDLLKRVRDLGVNAPVLMMSGDWDRRKEADALIEGAFGYLHKPFDLRELDRLVAGAIASATRG